MNIKIVLEGKIKEPCFKLGIEEYKKRLLNKVEILEISDIYEYLKNKTNSYVMPGPGPPGRRRRSPGGPGRPAPG